MMLSTNLSALGWRKSSFSESGNCVEIAGNSAAVLVRDTKHRSGSVLSFPFTAWEDFTRTIKVISTSAR
jgi:hypothetical protein